MFSNSCKYAIRATLYLAKHSHENQKVGVKEVAEALELPQPYLAKILQALTKRKLISSSKGRNGGFFLSAKDREHALEEIVEAIDGHDTFSTCILGLKVCSDDKPCPLHFQSQDHRDGLGDIFKKNTINDIANNLLEEQN